MNDDDLLMTDAELVKITGYRQAAKQLDELHKLGFFRARRDRFGQVIVERAHYHAVASGATGQPAANEERARPRVRA